MRGILGRWGAPEVVICDRFRLNELRDCARSVPVMPRVTRWSEASEDIRALRKIAADGPLACEAASRPLLEVSSPRTAFSGALVKSDDQGSVRLVKRDTNNTARDDVAQALTLAVGEFARRMSHPPRPLRCACNHPPS